MPREKCQKKKLTDERGAAPLIRRHYESLGLSVGWTPDKFNKLCRMANCLPEEMAALCNFSSKDLRKWYRSGLFPPHVALHFALIERFYNERSIGTVYPPVMPVHLLSRHD